MKVIGVLVLIVLFPCFLTESTDDVEDKVTNELGTISAAIGSLGSMKLGLTLGTVESEDYLDATENPDIFLTVPELIKKYGFPVESHSVFTHDDYVLTLHRIPHGRNVTSEGYNETTGKGQKKPVVLLHHGLCSSSADWIMNTPEKALPYLLADAGYDVWLANARGNTYSRRHITTTPKRSKYWDFSWHEIGKYDIPAVMDYVLKVTGEDDMDYIGHSMGTTVFFVAMSLNPKYNAKIRKMVALGPAVHLEDMKSPLRYLARFSTAEKFVYDIFENGELFSNFTLKYLHKFAPSACEDTAITSGVCDNLIYVVGGFNPDQTNKTQLPVILSHTPSPCSTKSGIHYLQTVSSSKFRQYDYGIIGNVIRYSQITPPKYNLKKVTSPIALYWGEGDIICDPKGVKRLAKELPNLIGSFKVNATKFTHIDFLFAKDADKLLYKDILKLLKT